MNIAKVNVSNNIARATDCKPITSGTVGATVVFSFDSTWDGYSKTFVWSAGGVTKDDTTASGIVPAEVLESPGVELKVGVYGIKGDHVTPTVWARLGKILQGARPSGEGPVEQALKEMQEDIDSLTRDTVDVKRLGAAGDGVTDDTAAIQTALNTYGTVVLPEGTYRVKGLTVTKSNTKIVGENATLKITDDCKITGNAIEGLGLYIHSTDPINPVRNIEVCGIHFDGNVQRFYDGGKDVTEDDFDSDGVRFYNAENIDIHHCTFDNFGDRGIGTTVPNYKTDTDHFGVHGLHVHDCEFFGADLPYQEVVVTADTPATANGYKPDPGTYHIYPTVNAIQILQTGEDECNSDIVVERCTVHKSPNYGFMFYPSTQRLTVRDCTILNCGLHTSEEEDINGGGGHIDYGYYTGKYAQADHCDGGGIKLNTVRDALVEGCYIYGVRGSNISVHDYSTATEYGKNPPNWPHTENVVIRDNTIAGNLDQLRTGHGIYIEGGENVRAVNNTIVDHVGAANRAHAVHPNKKYDAVKAIVANVPCLIDGNTIVNATNGVTLFSGRVVDNEISGTNTAIYAAATSKRKSENLVIKGNRVTSLGDGKWSVAVTLQNTEGAIVEGNIIEGFTRGVQNQIGSKDVTICGNLIRSTVSASRGICSTVTAASVTDGHPHENVNIYGNTISVAGGKVIWENSATSPVSTFVPANSKVDFVDVV